VPNQYIYNIVNYRVKTSPLSPNKDITAKEMSLLFFLQKGVCVRARVLAILPMFVGVY
jgi:hypothetical protein